MPKKRPSASADRNQPIVEQLERIGNELNLIRTALDELRSDFQWAVQNGRVTIAFPEQTVPVRFHGGDHVQIDDNKGIRTGEIVEMDHAIDRAWVATGPNEVESVAVESMTKQQQDVFTEDSPQPTELQLPDPGSLF